VLKSDKCIGVSQLLGHVLEQPPKYMYTPTFMRTCRMHSPGKNKYLHGIAVKSGINVF